MSDLAGLIREHVRAAAGTLQPVDAFGISGRLAIRQIDGHERDAMIPFITEHMGQESAIAGYIVANTLVDRETGDRVLDPSDADDRKTLQDMRFADLKALFDVAAEHNGLGDRDGVETAKKN